MMEPATKQRVLMVNKFYYPRGGAELYMLRAAELLENDGFDVLFFAPRNPHNLPCATERYFPSEIDFGDPAPGLPRVRAALRVLYSVESRRSLGALLRAEPVHVAHVHNIYHHLSPSILAALRARSIPVVMTVHDYKLVCPVYTLLSNGSVCERCVGGHFTNAIRFRCNRGSLSGSALVAVETWLHHRLGLYRRNIDVFITPSRFARGKLVAGGYPADRIRFVPNFVDATKFAPSFEPGSYFLYYGRLAHEKGVDVLLRAAAEAHAPLKIAGEGPARAELETTGAQLGVDVEFLGHLEFDDLARFVRGACAVVVPSRWHENCPLAVLEAMAWGKPVIGTTLGGMPELIEPGDQGLLVAPDDPGALATGLLEVQRSPAGAARMGASGRRKVEQWFSSKAHLAALRDVYAEATARSVGTR